MAYETIELDRFERFQDIKSEWNALLRDSSCRIPFLTHEWLSLWWAHFGSPHRLAVVLVREGGRLILAAPLMEVERRRLGLSFRILQSLSNVHSPRFHILVRAGDHAALDAFWAYLGRRPRPWHLLRLDPVPEDPLQQALADRAAASGHRVETRPSLSSPYVPIDRSWESFQSTLKPKFRSILRNRNKRLQAEGAVTFPVVKDAAPAPAAFEKALEVEASGWKGDRGTAIRMDPTVAGFYRALAVAAAAEGWLRLTFSKVAERFAAFDFSLVYDGRIYGLKVGYDPEFSPYSVGQLLCQEVLRTAHEEGALTYEFLGESSVQKRDWTTEAREHVHFYVYNRSALSRLHRLQRFTARRALKRWLPGQLVAAIRARRRD